MTFKTAQCLNYCGFFLWKFHFLPVYLRGYLVGRISSDDVVAGIARKGICFVGYRDEKVSGLVVEFLRSAAPFSSSGRLNLHNNEKCWMI